MTIDYTINIKTRYVTAELGLGDWLSIEHNRLVGELKLRQLIPFDFEFVAVSISPEMIVLVGYIKR